MKYISLHDSQFLSRILNLFHLQFSCSHGYALLPQNLTHHFYLSFIHLLFAKSLVALATITRCPFKMEWFIVVNSSMELYTSTWHVILFAWITCLYIFLAILSLY